MTDQMPSHLGRPRRCWTFIARALPLALAALPALPSQSRAIEAAPKATDQPDILEEVRHRQRDVDLRATGRALAVACQATLLYPLAPKRAGLLLQEGREAIHLDADVSTLCRETLARLLGAIPIRP